VGSLEKNRGGGKGRLHGGTLSYRECMRKIGKDQAEQRLSSRASNRKEMLTKKRNITFQKMSMAD